MRHRASALRARAGRDGVEDDRGGAPKRLPKRLPRPNRRGDACGLAQALHTWYIEYSIRGFSASASKWLAT